MSKSHEVAEKIVEAIMIERDFVAMPLVGGRLTVLDKEDTMPGIVEEIKKIAALEGYEGDNVLAVLELRDATIIPYPFYIVRFAVGEDIADEDEHLGFAFAFREEIEKARDGGFEEFMKKVFGSSDTGSELMEMLAASGNGDPNLPLS